MQDYQHEVRFDNKKLTISKNPKLQRSNFLSLLIHSILYKKFSLSIISFIYHYPRKRKPNRRKSNWRVQENFGYKIQHVCSMIGEVIVQKSTNQDLQEFVCQENFIMCQFQQTQTCNQNRVPNRQKNENLSLLLIANDKSISRQFVYIIGFSSQSYNKQVEMLKEPNSRANRRQKRSIERSPERTYSSANNSLHQFQNNHLFVEVANNRLETCIVKQRILKNEEIAEESFPNFIFGKHQYEPSKINKYLRLLHQGLLYSSLILGTPSQAFIKLKMVSLPESGNKKEKILMLDLDQTLIHCVKDHDQAEVALNCSLGTIRFNVRPFCQIFLQTMSKSFDIYVFTSATEEYAKVIIDYLNSKKKYIHGFLHRAHCLETKRGFRIKDLRIIKNRDLSKIVMVDNLVHSFGLQLQNGIPILQFTNQKEDKELLGLVKVLRELEGVEDVRVFLRHRFNLLKFITYSQEAFLKLNYQKSSHLKPRQTIG